MIQTKTVDITPMKITLPVIEMSQYDLGREIIIHMKDGSDWFDLTGYTAKLQGTKPSGFGYTVDGVVDGHDITFASNYDMTSEAGFIPSEVRLTKDGVSLGSLNVMLHVEKTPHDVNVTDGSPETIVSEMTELVERAEAAAEVLLDCSAIATTLPAGSNATASYDVDNGVFTFGIPRGNKGETGDTGATGNGIASITKTGTSGLVDTYTITFTNGTTTTFTVTNGQNGTGAVADVWQNGVSVLDGTTAKVTVPTYDAVTDNEPYLFRQSGNGLDIHNREHDTLVGGSVAWNQLVQNGNFETTTGWSSGGGTMSVSSNVGKVTLTGSAWNNDLRTNFTAPVNHVYYMTFKLTGSEGFDGKYMDFAEWNASAYFNVVMHTTQTTYQKVFKSTVGGSNTIKRFSPTVNGSTMSGEYFEVANVNVFDLTQMFGSTIADYIYSLEQSNAGAGVAWFRKLFPKAYYAYDAGELKSVSGLVSHDMTGFNQWDEEWELGSIGGTGNPYANNSAIRSKNYCSILPSTTYHFRNSTGVGGIYEYDADKNFIQSTAVNNTDFTTSANAAYFKIAMNNAYGTSYLNDLCVNIKWDGSRDGEYEPYVKHSYALDSTLTLRGIPKLSNGKLYYDGDVYEADGTVTRKYGIVDLGSLTWQRTTTRNGKYRFYSTGINDVDKRPSAMNIVSNIICSKYVTADGNAAYEEIQSVGVHTNGNVNVYDNAYSDGETDATAFKTAMSGVYLVYELATPTTEEAEPYTNPQIVDDFGTEEYVSTSIVPVGHQTAYPDLFSGDYNDLVNKPTIPTETSQLTNDSDFVIDASYVHTDNNYTSAEKSKLSGIASGAEVNVQSDWNATSGDALILHKPTIPKISSVAVTLAVANWSNNSQTVSVTGVTASNNVIVSPAPASIDDYVAGGIKCTAQASNSLTFTCTTTPTSAISVNVLILS